MIKKPDDFGYDAARENNGDRAIGENKETHPPVLAGKGENQKTQNQNVRQILGRENGKVVQKKVAAAELENQPEKILVNGFHEIIVSRTARARDIWPA